MSRGGDRVVDDQDGGGTGVEAIPRVRVEVSADVPVALERLDLRRNGPVLVLIGGAGGMTETHFTTLCAALQRAVLPLLDRLGATVPIPAAGCRRAGHVAVPGA
jgi:hypothetical protein